MYSVQSYGNMIADRIRTDAYARALKRLVRPDSSVADIGAGTGIFSLLACLYGARRVYAIEPSNAIQLAEEIARVNGFGGRIEFLRAHSTQIQLAEPVDVIVSDLRGVLPLFERHLPSIVDARRRFLAPSGKIIPERDTLWATIVDAPDSHSRLLRPWSETPFGLDMTAGSSTVTNIWVRDRFEPAQIVSTPQCWGEIRYDRVTSPNLGGSLSFRPLRRGLAHGLGVWFDALLAEGVHLSNAPGEPDLIYGSGFFPWPRPLMLEESDNVDVRISANLVGDDYIWSWKTTVRSGGEKIKAQHQQSTFYSVPLSVTSVRKRATTYKPQLTPRGVSEMRTLALMDGGHSNESIARILVTEFPDQFRSEHDALSHVGDVSVRLGH